MFPSLLIRAGADAPVTSAVTWPGSQYNVANVAIEDKRQMLIGVSRFLSNGLMAILYNFNHSNINYQMD